MKERDKKLYACVDVHITENQKIARAGAHIAEVGWLHIAGITYAKRNNTDGFIPALVASMLTPNAKKTLKILTEICELWEKTADGFRIHHYSEWQETSAEIVAKREARSAAGAAGGVKSGISRSKKANTKEPSKTRSKHEANASPFEAPTSKQNTKQNEADEDEDVNEDKEVIPPVAPQGAENTKERRWSTPSNYVGYYMDGFYRLYGDDPLIEGKEKANLFAFAQKCKSPETYGKVIDGFFASTDGWAASRHHSVACLVGEQPDRWLPKIGTMRASPVKQKTPGPTREQLIAAGIIQPPPKGLDE